MRGRFARVIDGGGRAGGMEMVFAQKYEWALLPRKAEVDARAATVRAELYERHFRWIRRRRARELCWPWRLAEELGWLIPSPVDVTMAPLDDAEVACAADERDAFAAATG